MSRILVVEDNEKNMYLIGFILKKMGHQVLQAGTGEQVTSPRFRYHLGC